MNKVITFQKPVYINATSCVGGKKESEGPLAAGFDSLCKDDYFGMDTWEKAETEMQKRSLRLLLEKCGLKAEDVPLAFGGDLCDQITSTAFAYRDFPMSFLGQYGACSTMAQSMAMAACMVGAGYVQKAVAGASSHFCTAERQFRTPLAYGGKRTPTAQWTVTGAAHALLSDRGSGPLITRVFFGRVVDLGITDANNMGAAMAPAAADTIKSFLHQTGGQPDDYDRIFTGDLGKIGSLLLKQLLQKEEINLHNHQDCGLLIYDLNRQNVQSGASGCGCSGCTLSSYIMPRLLKKEYKKILFIATGALLSPTSSMQKESIPSIAHLVEICAGEGDI